jgi:predicted nucleic acid-binding protein
VILVDANILMYAAGAEHPSKAPSVALLEAVGSGRLEAAIDAEVLQELLHRYRAIGRWHDGRRVYDAARRVFPVVYPITEEITDVARALLDEVADLGARDALHAAVAASRGLGVICSYDRHFDRLPGLQRRTPEELVAGL